jgi:flagellar biogenesis protein FliO
MSWLPRMVVLVPGLWAVAPACASEPATEHKPAMAQTHSDSAAALQPPAAQNAPDNQFLRRPRAAARPAHAAGPSGGTAGWLRTGAALAGVTALIVLLAWGYRAGTNASQRLVGWRWRGAGPVQLISRLSLAPRQSLYLVRIGPKLVLIGSAGQTLSGLCAIDDAELAARLTGQGAAADPESHTREFQKFLSCQEDAYRPAAVETCPGRMTQDANTGSDVRGATAAACRRLTQLLQQLRRLSGSV